MGYHLHMVIHANPVGSNFRETLMHPRNERKAVGGLVVLPSGTKESLLMGRSSPIRNDSS